MATMKTSEFIRAAADRYLAPNMKEYLGSDRRSALCFCFGDYYAYATPDRDKFISSKWMEVYPELYNHINQDLLEAHGQYLFNRHYTLEGHYPDSADNFQANQMDRFVYAEFMALYFEDLEAEAEEGKIE